MYYHFNKLNTTTSPRRLLHTERTCNSTKTRVDTTAHNRRTAAHNRTPHNHCAHNCTELHLKTHNTQLPAPTTVHTTAQLHIAGCILYQPSSTGHTAAHDCNCAHFLHTTTTCHCKYYIGASSRAPAPTVSQGLPEPSKLEQIIVKPLSRYVLEEHGELRLHRVLPGQRLQLLFTRSRALLRA